MLKKAKNFSFEILVELWQGHTGTRFNGHSQIGMNRVKGNLQLLGLRFEFIFGSY